MFLTITNDNEKFRRTSFYWTAQEILNAEHDHHSTFLIQLDNRNVIIETRVERWYEVYFLWRSISNTRYFDLKTGNIRSWMQIHQKQEDIKKSSC